MLPNFDTCRFKRPNGRDGTGCFRAGLNQPPTLRKKILNAGAGGGEGRLYTDSNKETCRISSTSYKRTKLVYDSLSYIYTFHIRVSLFGCGEVY